MPYSIDIFTQPSESMREDLFAVGLSSFQSAFQNPECRTKDPDIVTDEKIIATYTPMLRDDIENIHNGYAYLAKIDGKIIGWAFFLPENIDSFYVSLVVVDPMYQGQKVGTKLLFAILDTFPNTKTLFLYVRRVNENAYKIFQHLGFSECSYQRDSEKVDPHYIASMKLEFMQNQAD